MTLIESLNLWSSILARRPFPDRRLQLELYLFDSFKQVAYNNW